MQKNLKWQTLLQLEDDLFYCGCGHFSSPFKIQVASLGLESSWDAIVTTFSCKIQNPVWPTSIDALRLMGEKEAIF